MHDLFISYCRRDLDAANALADTLLKAGLSVWLDREGFRKAPHSILAQTSVVVIWCEQIALGARGSGLCARQAQAQ